MKHILITGGHSGIGYELTKLLLQEKDIQLGLVIRSEARKKGLPPDLLNADNISYFYGDLSDQASVLQLASSVKTSWDRLDILYNNAGVLLDDFYESKQGNEMHLEVNTLAPYILTNALKSLFEQANQPLVVNTLTGGLHNKKKLKTEVFTRDVSFKKLFGAYLESKFATGLFFRELQNHIPRLRVINVDPGPNKTKMTKGSGVPKVLLLLRNLIFSGPEKGGKLLYQAAFDPKHQEESYAYITSNKKKPWKYQLSEAEKSLLLQAIAEVNT